MKSESVSEPNWTYQTALEQLAYCNYECEAGELTMNSAFQWLTKHSPLTPHPDRWENYLTAMQKSYCHSEIVAIAKEVRQMTVEDCAVAPMEGVPEPLTPVQTLAFSIADEAAQMDLDSCCVGSDEWSDTTKVDDEDERECVAKSVRYLDLRGKLQHHPEHGELVKVISC